MVVGFVVAGFGFADVRVVKRVMWMRRERANDVNIFPGVLRSFV